MTLSSSNSFKWLERLMNQFFLFSWTSLHFIGQQKGDILWQCNVEKGYCSILKFQHDIFSEYLSFIAQWSINNNQGRKETQHGRIDWWISSILWQNQRGECNFLFLCSSPPCSLLYVPQKAYSNWEEIKKHTLWLELLFTSGKCRK